MKNLWNQAMSNEEIVIKFKSTISEFLINQDFDYVGQYLKDLCCAYFYHEFVKRALVMVIEKVSLNFLMIKNDETLFEPIIRLIVLLNHKYDMTKV